mmetsp:Transcript_52601/g.167250  ORF Transcript_52601/g.167250 Transcript_52601/m.167250 type:complete len:222 (-) Transcript_52601:158-823(-)
MSYAVSLRAPLARGLSLAAPRRAPRRGAPPAGAVVSSAAAFQPALRFQLDCKAIEPRKWELQKPLEFRHEPDGAVREAFHQIGYDATHFCVPEGFVSDCLSHVAEVVFDALSPAEIARTAILHDYLFQIIRCSGTKDEAKLEHLHWAADQVVKAALYVDEDLVDVEEGPYVMHEAHTEEEKQKERAVKGVKVAMAEKVLSHVGEDLLRDNGEQCEVVFTFA